MSATVPEALVSIVACGGVALALVLRDPRLRYLAMGVGLLAAIGLIAGQVWDQARFTDIRDRPELLLAGAAFGAIALGATASIFIRAPAAFAIAAVILMPLRVPVGVGGETNFLLVPLYGVIAGGFLRAVWLLARRQDEQLRSASSSSGDQPAIVRWLCWALAASLVVYGVAVAWSDDPVNATRQVAFFLAPFAALFVLLRDLRWYRKLVVEVLLAFTAVAVVFAAVAIYQHATRDLILNTDLENANQLHLYFRVNSLFRDPNVLGRYLAIAIVAVAAFIAYTDRRRDALAATVVCGVLLLALIYTFSISSLGALLAGLGALIWIRLGRRGLAAVAAIAVVGALSIVVAGGPPSSGGATARLEGRDSLVKGGIELFGKRPIVGFGAGSFAISYRREIERVQQPVSHAEPITVAAEEGVLGLVPYGAVLLFAALIMIRPWPARTPIRAGVAACFAALFIHTLGYAGFSIDPMTWVLLALGTVAISLESRAGEPADRTASAPG